jgi:hypothetical protein
MGFWDLICEFWNGTPDPKQVSRTLRLLGALCFSIPILAWIMPFPDNPQEAWTVVLSHGLAVSVWIIAPMTGLLFFAAGYLIYRGREWGKWPGQIATAVLGVLLPCYQLSVAMLVGVNRIPPPAPPSSSEHPESIIPALLPLAIIFLSYLIPAFFGILYMGHLRINRALDEQDSAVAEWTSTKELSLYRSSPSPFGEAGTFILIVFLGFLILSLTPKRLAPLGVPIALAIVVGPLAFNFMVSPFQKQRVVVGSFWGGGAIYLLHGTWPFFRLLVYQDGLEVRIMLNRYFIPYGQMDCHAGFLKIGLLIKSQLPNVPSRIRFYGRTRTILRLIEEQTESLNSQAGSSARELMH